MSEEPHLGHFQGEVFFRFQLSTCKYELHMYINTADVSLFWFEGFVFHFSVGCLVRKKLLLKIVLCTCVLFVGLTPLGVILEPVQVFYMSQFLSPSV